MKTTPLISFEEIPPITDQQKSRVAAQIGRLIPTHEQHELLMMLGIVDTPRRADT